MKINETHESCFSFLLDTYNIPEASVRIFVHVTRGPTWNVTFFFCDSYVIMFCLYSGPLI